MPPRDAIADDAPTREAPPSAARLARGALAAFVLTFIAARGVVYLIMARAVPDLYLFVGGTHVHHLNYGIFLLAGVGAYLIFRRPTGRWLSAAAIVYGISLALTFDEFGMWLHLGGSYWQRASYDAIVVIASLLGLVAAAPSIRRFRPHHWATTAVVAIAALLFAAMILESLRLAENAVVPRLERLDAPDRPK